MMYLFNSPLGNWAYYDTGSNMVVEIGEWKDRAANIAGDWVSMTKYFRIVVQFLQPVTFSLWDATEKKLVDANTEVAVLTITKTAYDYLVTAKEGRPQESWFRFLYKVVNRKNGQMIYVNGVEYVDPANLPSVPKPRMELPKEAVQPEQPSAQPSPVTSTTKQPPSDLAPSLPDQNVVQSPQPTTPPVAQPPVAPSGPALPNFYQ